MTQVTLDPDQFAAIMYGISLCLAMTIALVIAQIGRR